MGKLINVGTEDYSLWIPAGIPVSVMGVKVADNADEGDSLIHLKTRIIFHDGSGHKYDSPLSPSQVVRLIENSNNDVE